MYSPPVPVELFTIMQFVPGQPDRYTAMAQYTHEHVATAQLKYYKESAGGQVYYRILYVRIESDTSVHVGWRDE